MNINYYSVLTATALLEPGWDAALHARLPIEPSLELLYEARHLVVTYLDWYSNDVGSVTPAETLRRDINLAAARLIEICLAIQDADSRKPDRSST
jgi:hypothetical protein